EDVLEIGRAGLLHGGADLFVAGALHRADGEVDTRDSRSGHAEGHTSELAFHFGADQADGPGGAGGAGDDVDGGAAASLPVFLAGTVHGFLRGGVAVDGGHEALFDAKAFFQKHMHHGSQAVGGATGVGDDVVIGRIVFVMVHAHDDGNVF